MFYVMILSICKVNVEYICNVHRTNPNLPWTGYAQIYYAYSIDLPRPTVSVFLDSTFLLYTIIYQCLWSDWPIDLCMRDKKESAVVLSIVVDTTNFMKESCE